MEYTILKERTIEKLIESVSQYIAQGWQPKGGVATEAGYSIYYQAMVRG
jgi:hypothetical protein